MQPVTFLRTPHLNRLGFAFVIAVIALLLSFAGAVPSAAAAPAERVDESGCDYIDPYNELMQCYDVSGISQRTESASGNVVVTESGQYCFQFFFNGKLVNTECGTYHFTEVVRAGEPQVFRGILRAEHTVGDRTCTSTFGITEVNGEVRRALDSFECW